MRTALWRRALARLRDASWAIDANDGIISTAGVLQGFAGAGAGDRLLLFTAVATLLAGGISAGGAKWAEASAEREEQLRLAALEQADLDRDPARELDELTEHWQSQGLTPELARQVAEQLTAHNALAAQLDADHGIEEIMTPTAPLLAGVQTMIAFMIGSAIPLAMTFIAPVAIETTAIIVAVVISLVLTSLVAAGSGHVSVKRMLGRTLTVGLGTMLIGYAAGLVFF